MRVANYARYSTDKQERPGKLKCGVCGAGYSKTGKHCAACHAATKLGPRPALTG